ncbi:MAG: tetratricopeptide repeat protein [Reichenbachiella sp.]|uniref:tetratricopeptide repeat protein n=1 Tax=Reichenbachiella sp. TaxID=2184521 RepID=UPI0032659BA5
MIPRLRLGFCNYSLLLLIVVLGTQSCNGRFGAYPLTEKPLTTLVSDSGTLPEVKRARDMDVNDVIQYLNLHEESSWIHTTEAELISLVNEFDDSPEIHELVADYYLTIGNVEEALVYNTKAEERGARSTEFYKKRAEVFAALGQYGLAIDYLNKAVKINGNDPDIYLSKGEVYLNMGDSISSLQYKSHAFIQDSSRLDIAADLAYLYARHDELDKSRNLIDLLIASDYRPKEMKKLDASLYRRKGQMDQANAIYKSLLDSGDTAAGVVLIDHFKQQNLHDSIVHYSTLLLEQDSSNLFALEAKAISFDYKGYYTSALIYYNQMLDIDSLNQEAHEGIRKVKGKIAYLRKLKEQKEAIPNFDFLAPKRNELIDE